ncbi:MAG TPA: ATP-dependent helicase, partial [Bacillota bacterium]|nr:ATP-dependent helicase [Bacillota bacterium]
GKTNYVQADIYQMYAYVTAYENVERCILLYPNQELEAVHPIWEVIDTDKTIEMHTVRIDDISKTIDALMEIIAHEYI